MGSSHDSNGTGQGCDGDVVRFGRTRLRRSPPWISPALLAVLVAVAGLAVVFHGSRPRHQQLQVSVTDLGHPILGVRAGWELFGIDDRGTVLVQFARGRVIRTAIPPLESDGGPFSLVPARDGVIVRPLADVPGYVVPDGQPARPLTGALARGGTLLPGPAPGLEWLASDTIQLIGPGGRTERARLAIPADLRPSDQVISDGNGGLILSGASGSVYDAAPGGLLRIDALPLAVGPRTLLALHCGQASCHNVVISTPTGVSRQLPGSLGPVYPWPWQPLPGIVSPDGRTAAVVVIGQAGIGAKLDLISLSTGAVTQVPVRVGQMALSQSLAWSPDSKWLFVVTASGSLAVVDARAGQPRHLGVALTGLRQIVMCS